MADRSKNEDDVHCSQPIHPLGDMDIQIISIIYKVKT